MNRPRLDITGLILAGGTGRRMGGMDKGLIPWQGRPLVAHVLQRLQPQVGSTLISANRNIEQYAALGCPVFPDNRPDYAGPLAGIEAGLSVCTTRWLLCVPCDTPLLPLDLADRLLAEVGHEKVAVATSPDRIHGTFMLCRRDLLPRLTEFLDRGHRKVMDWLEVMDAVMIRFPEESAFANFNQPHDLSSRDTLPP
ncbi:MAG: molybdenum cofactor guanylyltransferase [Proteobacteria bacterium]|nr:molybdenum cofactor guanylyltransferase [Pseudomonadota bacterium]HQR03117.1 molybdenum cofactor guanylyltransferase MobA [Rhodocyclaceae bacterium]